MRRRAKLGELKSAKEFGGRRQPGSGSGELEKGDGKSGSLADYDGYLIERKDTSRFSYAVSIATMDKLRQQALRHDREPVLILGMGGREYAIIDKDHLLDLNRKANESASNSTEEVVSVGAAPNSTSNREPPTKTAYPRPVVTRR